MNSTRCKLSLAAKAVNVLVAMGALRAAVSGPEAAAENEFGGAGETSTQSTAPTEIETPSAAPEVKAEPYEP